MKTGCGHVRFVVRQFPVMIAIFLLAGYVAEAQDFRAFDSQESYVFEGASIVLTQKVGEATAIFQDASLAAQQKSSLSTTSGASFSRIVELPRRLAIYEVQTTIGRTISASESAAAITSLNSDTNLAYAYPVYVNPTTGNRVFLNNEIVVKLNTASALQDTNLAPFKLRLVETLNVGDNIHVLRLTDPKSFNPFKVCNAIRALPGVVWAEPNFAQEANQFVIPNDTLFSSQWHLRNTGQSGGTSDADVDADDAWSGSQPYGSPGIRVAIIDDGVQTDHPDLSANIVQGYDWYSGDSDPNPDGIYNNHGTAVAGLAAAAVNNSLGVAGVAGKCQILPVRLLNTYDSAGHAFLPDALTVYRALVYAGDNADIINCSWGGLSPNATISYGFSYAWQYGRNGLGCLIFCSSGNGASGWLTYTLTGFSPSTYTFDWLYTKDTSGSAGDDTVWLDSVVFPGGAIQTFEGTTLPLGWTTTPGSAASWTSVQDGVGANHALVAWNGEGSRCVRAGGIGNSLSSGLETTQTVGAGDLTFRVWVSSQSGLDGWIFYVNSVPYFSNSGIPSLTTDVTYPASLSSVYAVGATSDFDYRADFSQYGSTLDFVAPGGGGSGGIATTDRTGANGYNQGDTYDPSGNYLNGFGGTSASAPIAAGIGALVLSKNGNQTRVTLANTLIQHCDKIGPVAYTGSPTRNDYYGYGRLNANLAATAATADAIAPVFVSAKVVNYRAVDVSFSEPMGEGVLTPGSYSITTGGNTLATHPAKVVRITPKIYRLVWTAGDMVTSGTVTITASTAIKDVAGNALSGTLARSSTGTKRIIAVNGGGSPNVSSGFGTYYAAPFISDDGFQGNEANPLLAFTSEMAANYWFNGYIDLSAVTDPAPEVVYKTSRVLYYSSQVMEYTIPVTGGPYKVRLHFCQNYFNNYGDEVFDIYVNNTLVASRFETLLQAGAMHKATLMEVSNVSPVSGAITVKLDPQPGNNGWSSASICGLEIVKP